jgi:hypothetical protein
MIGESACRPGSVIPLAVTCGYSPGILSELLFTSHGFSSVPVSFRPPAEQRRNWQKPGDSTVIADVRALLATGKGAVARCADATCTFTVDFTDFSRLRTSTAPSRLNAPRTARRIRFRSAPGPEAGAQE